MPGIDSVAGVALPSAALPSARPGASSAKIEDAARQFEALLVGQLLRSARQAGSEGWLGTGEDQTASSVMELAEEQFAQALTSQGGLGLAGMIVSGMRQK
jgi:Rod binding domain-containing protein